MSIIYTNKQEHFLHCTSVHNNTATTVWHTVHHKQIILMSAAASSAASAVTVAKFSIKSVGNS